MVQDRRMRGQNRHIQAVARQGGHATVDQLAVIALEVKVFQFRCHGARQIEHGVRSLGVD